MSGNRAYSYPASIAAQAVCYATALAAAIGTGYLARDFHPLWIVLIADMAATFVVFGFSAVFRNSSLYDPYWSVQPIVIAGFWFWWGPEAEASQLRGVLAAGLLTLWGVRLTANFFYGWKGLHQEDWRYVDLRASSGRAFWLVNLTGIQLFPTVLVYLGCIPLMPAIATGTAPFGLLDYVATAIMAVALYLETVGDIQLHRFAASNTEPGKTLDTGLWAWSRHPNYLGEILIWWGLALYGLGAGGPWWILSGAVAITLLFVFISIPMIEKRHHARRPDYAAYCSRVPMLIPGLHIPRRPPA